MSTEITYVIEGKLWDKNWVQYANLGACSSARAREVYESWQECRAQLGGSETVYRLLRRVSETEVVLTEDL